MRLFEQFDNPEMMIIVAKAAIFLAKNAKSKEVVSTFIFPICDIL